MADRTADGVVSSQVDCPLSVIRVDDVRLEVFADRTMRCLRDDGTAVPIDHVLRNGRHTVVYAGGYQFHLRQFRSKEDAYQDIFGLAIRTMHWPQEQPLRRAVREVRDGLRSEGKL